ncbi:glutamine--fructose-6-phosphate transaminase (isomerizing) [Facklamia sp. DSM 111018]|uniref:Glutamine--fructose-6-phosphate aminotransferase [isomerizing] n=1 Tax=Facklamia lactis TaxID=2749967 RepID=A0ABS0LQ71_9LACT|nr:glutamine--fructose-6-phosphate transaminase (isomerizing) [Facklamia lactis]MBG9986102.1 glutamine--fructose-6-phosphate transaminase (isomerizing) [Facklamia lactis]
MCGIVGFIGQANCNVQEVLIKGLEKLEYRGYDSAGIFISDQKGNAQLFKTQGPIAKLKEIVNFDSEASVGIGHTRWATHGAASTENAHPHQSNTRRFTLIHNGVIENYQELKVKYLPDIRLKSQTDTEVIVALIEKFVLEDNMQTKDAFKKTLSLIHGSYAFALMDIENPQVLYAAKSKSPLLIGIGDDFNVIASDAMATIEATNEYLEIEDGEIITLTRESVMLERLDGSIVKRDSYQAEIDHNDLDKGTYPYYMIKEIDEQPAVIRRNIQAYQNEAGEWDLDLPMLEAIRKSDRLYILACGTSYHAGLIGKVLFEELAGIATEVHLASEFAYHPPLLSEKPFFIFISQSGETADSRQALVKVKQLAYPTLTITNVKGSTLSRESDYTLLLNAGPEIAVASTKAYTAQITILAILANRIADNDKIDLGHELSISAHAIESVLSQKEKLQTWVQSSLKKSRNAFYIGRYVDYYVALEAALKLKEISYIQTEAFASGELKHGTIALIEEGTPVIAIMTDESTAANTRGNIEEVKARGALNMVISMKKLFKEQDDFVIEDVHALLTPLVTAVVGQLIAYFATLDRELDVDKPRNLAKSVTVE